MHKILYAKPSITSREVELVTEAAASGWGEHCYDFIERFENIFKEHLGLRHTLATSSCTGAWQMGLAALGFKPGDEVIMADLNWMATAAPIIHLGGKPVLVDVLPDSLCLDPKQVEAAITERTRAIAATHLYGNLCDMKALLKIGEKHGLPVLEDAAEALGSVHHGRPAGAWGRFSVFSFHGTKTITTGEGGLLATDDSELYESILTLSNHGRRRGQKRQFWADRPGFKFKMSNIQAALGCAQMARLEELVAKKRLIFQWYQDRLQGLPLRLNPQSLQDRPGFWMTTAIVDDGVAFDREKLLEDFKQHNIDSRIIFWPLSQMWPDLVRRVGENQIAYRLSLRGFNLPSYHDLSEEDVIRVTDCVKRSFS